MVAFRRCGMWWVWVCEGGVLMRGIERGRGKRRGEERGERGGVMCVRCVSVYVYRCSEPSSPSSDPQTPPAQSPCPRSCAGSSTACR